MKKRKQKWLSLLLSFVLVLGLVPVIGLTAKANTITEIAVTMELPREGEKKEKYNVWKHVDAIYDVSVHKLLKGSYKTVEEVKAAMKNDTVVMKDDDAFEKNKSYTIVFIATTSKEANNIFQGESMPITVNGEDALFVYKPTIPKTDNVIFAYTFRISDITEYNLKIAGVNVKSNNLTIDQNDTSLIKGGFMTYVPATHTLTMNNVVATGNFKDFFLEYNGADKLTIQVVGENKVKFTQVGWQGIRSVDTGGLRITSNSEGKLSITGELLKIGIYFDYGGLVLDGNLHLMCNIVNLDSAMGIVSDSGGILTVEDDVNLGIYTNVNKAATSPISMGIQAMTVINGGTVLIEAQKEGYVMSNVLGMNFITRINGGVLTVKCARQAIDGSITFDYPHANPKITASSNYDGSNPVTYKSSNQAGYKYIKVEKGEAKTAISNLKIDALSKPVAGEVPVYTNFSDEKNIDSTSAWCVWDEKTKSWSEYYDEVGKEAVDESVFRAGRKYALSLHAVPKSTYTFPLDMPVLYNEVNVPAYIDSTPNVTHKKISSSGSSLDVLITEDDMPADTRKPITSAQITINGYKYGGKAEDVTVALNAVGADFYTSGEFPLGWALAIDEDNDGAPDGIATGDFKMNADYYLLFMLKAKAGYRMSSLTEDKITMSDGTASIGNIFYSEYFSDGMHVAYKLPKIALPQYNISVTNGKATVSGSSVAKAEAGAKVTLTANAAPAEKVFDKWVVVSGGVTLADVNSAVTTFTMPEKAVEVKATYKDDSTKLPATGDLDVKVPEAGTVLTSADSKAVYKVTGTDATNPTLEYTAPVSKTKKTITVPATVKIGDITYKVTSIAKNAFKNNKRMTKITIGSNVKTIGANAFSGCKKLTRVTIGKNVTTIGDKAFYKCTALTKITIPSKVSKIGKSAFYGCKKLKTITIKTTKLTDKKVGSKAFKGIHSKAVIKVPKSKLKVYKKMLKKKGIGKGVRVKK